MFPALNIPVDGKDNGTLSKFGCRCLAKNCTPLLSWLPPYGEIREIREYSLIRIFDFRVYLIFLNYRNLSSNKHPPFFHFHFSTTVWGWERERARDRREKKFLDMLTCSICSSNSFFNWYMIFFKSVCNDKILLIACRSLIITITNNAAINNVDP